MWFDEERVGNAFGRLEDDIRLFSIGGVGVGNELNSFCLFGFSRIRGGELNGIRDGQLESDIYELAGSTSNDGGNVGHEDLETFSIVLLGYEFFVLYVSIGFG